MQLVLSNQSRRIASHRTFLHLLINVSSIWAPQAGRRENIPDCVQVRKKKRTCVDLLLRLLLFFWNSDTLLVYILYLVYFVYNRRVNFDWTVRLLPVRFFEGHISGSQGMYWPIHRLGICSPTASQGLWQLGLYVQHEMPKRPSVVSHAC